MRPVKFVLEQDSANDDSALIIRVHQTSGSSVAEGAPIVDVETSKVTQEIVAPASGILLHELADDQTVEFGAVLFTILPEGSTLPVEAESARPAAALLPVAPSVMAAAPTPPGIPAAIVKASAPAALPERPAAPPLDVTINAEPRVTQCAKVFAEEQGVDIAQIPGDFITVEHIKRHLGLKPAEMQASTPARVEKRTAPSATTRGPGVDALPSRKRRERQALSHGAGATMLSVVGATVGRVKRRRTTAEFFAGKIVDLIAYEASRLMRQHPRLNAAYVEDDSIRLHPDVNAGVAFDDGVNGLVVFALPHSDRLGLADIQAGITNGLEKYLLGSLTGADLSSATFSITDLSSLGVDAVLPLLPQGQSAIIGVTTDGNDGFKLYLGFDHRVTEGRDAALFLQELVARLRSFAQSADAAEVLSCDFCGKTAEDEVSQSRGKGLLKLSDGQGRDRLCCRVCYDGW